MLNINFRRRILDNLPFILRGPERMAKMKAMSKPFRVIFAEFSAKRTELFYKATFNGEVIYLETALNDRFDPISRGITVTDAFFSKLFIRLKSENKPSPILYRKWNSTDDFITGKFCWKNGLVYESNTTPNINKVPGVDPEWDVTTRKAPVLRMKANFNGEIHFLVKVPSSVTFIEDEMKALIKFYKLAGLGYAIIII